MSSDVNSPQTIQVNFDPSLECLLRELRYITNEPLNYPMPSIYRELIPLIDNDRWMRLNVERLRSAATKYNSFMENIQFEERDLFQSKLTRIDEVGLGFFSFEFTRRFVCSFSIDYRSRFK